MSRINLFIILIAIILPSCSVKNIENAVDLNEKIVAANNAFELAESNVFNTTPVVPIVPDDIKPPDPDADKCPCKGTGVITHGDGHKTECPFHSMNLILNKHKE